jgi:hypothetical protein
MIYSWCTFTDSYNEKVNNLQIHVNSNISWRNLKLSWIMDEKQSRVFDKGPF